MRACEVHSFSTSPNLRHHLTVLNANVPNCYVSHLFTKNYQYWWKFDEVLTKTNLLSFFGDTV